MTPLLIIGSVLIAWAVLASFGNHHQEKMNAMRAKIATELANQAPAATDIAPKA